MNHHPMSAVLCLAAAVISVSSYAGDHRTTSRAHRHAESGMQRVTVLAQAGEPGHGWQYFTDTRAGRAVVISPGGNYYYSHGEGLTLVFKASEAA